MVAHELEFITLSCKLNQAGYFDEMMTKKFNEGYELVTSIDHVLRADGKIEMIAHMVRETTVGLKED